MNIDTCDIKRCLETQIETFKMLGGAVYSEFNDGVIQGFNLVKTFIELYEKREDKAMAENYGVEA